MALRLDIWAFALETEGLALALADLATGNGPDSVKPPADCVSGKLGSPGSRSGLMRIGWNLNKYP